MKYRKIASLLLAGATVLLVLSSCGGRGARARRAAAEKARRDSIERAEFVKDSLIKDSIRRVEAAKEAAKDDNAWLTRERNSFKVVANFNDPRYLPGFEDYRRRIPVKGLFGAYLSLKNKERLDKYIRLAETTELNAIVINIKSDEGCVTYPMDCAAARENNSIVNMQGNVKALVDTLHAHGIYAIARIVCFKDARIMKKHPEWMIHTKSGEIYVDKAGDRWVNPYCQEACKYIVDISEQAVLDGFDEICFDYIRTATWHNYTMDFGPEADSVKLTTQLARFTRYAVNRLAPLGAMVSASVYGSIIKSDVDARTIGQDYVELAKYLDYICPMVYPSHYANNYAGLPVPDAQPYKLIKYDMGVSEAKLAELRRTWGRAAECRPWYQAFTASWVKGHISYTPSVIREQVRAGYEMGVDNWMYWNAAGSYNPDVFLSPYDASKERDEIAAALAAQKAEQEALAAKKVEEEALAEAESDQEVE